MLKLLIYKVFADENTGSNGSSGGTTPSPGTGTTVDPNAGAEDSGITLLPGEEHTLADKIKSGEIGLNDIPAFISYFIEVAIIVAGIIAFLMIIVGAYQYIIGGVYSDMREQGKTTLTYAISGFVIALLAYAIVNLVQLAATAL